MTMKKTEQEILAFRNCQARAEEITLSVIAQLKKEPNKVVNYVTAFGFTVGAMIDEGVIKYFLHHDMNTPIGKMIKLMLDRFNELLIEESKNRQQKDKQKNKQNKKITYKKVKKH